MFNSKVQPSQKKEIIEKPRQTCIFGEKRFKVVLRVKKITEYMDNGNNRLIYSVIIYRVLNKWNSRNQSTERHRVSQFHNQ